VTHEVGSFILAKVPKETTFDDHCHFDRAAIWW
jgi:hypothetical protein